MALGLSNIVIGLVISALMIPLLGGKVRMNPYYGFRFAVSFRSPWHWKMINRYGARVTLPWSLGMVPLGIVCLAGARFAGPVIMWTLILLSTLALVLPPLKTYRYARALR